MNEPSDVTQALIALSEGESAALDRLLPMVYDELKRMAERELRRERPRGLRVEAIGAQGVHHHQHHRQTPLAIAGAREQRGEQRASRCGEPTGPRHDGA